MKQFLYTACALFVTAISFAQNDDWTLQECVQYAIDQNIQIKQTELDLETANVERRDAIGAILPNLNASANNNWNSGLTQNVVTGVLENQTVRNSSYNITAGIRIFGGFRNLKALDRAELSKIAAQYNLSRLKDDIALNVAVSFLNVLLAKENFKTIEQQNNVTQDQIKQTEALVEGGVLPRGDLLEIQATNASEQQRIVAAQNGVRVALVGLAQLLNIDNYETFDIADQEYTILGEKVLEYTPELLIAKAKETRYDIKIAEQNAEIARKDLEISKAALLPTINGFFNYNTRETDRKFPQFQIDENNPFILSDTPSGVTGVTGEQVFDFEANIVGIREVSTPFIDQLWQNDGISYGVSLNVPIFNGWNASNQAKRAKLNVRRLELQKEQAAFDLETAVFQAYTDAKAAKEAYNAAVVALESQQLAFNYAKERYDVGLTNAFDFSQSKLRLDNAQIEVTRSKYDYIFRIKVLELYFGIPAKDLKF